MMRPRSRALPVELPFAAPVMLAASASALAVMLVLATGLAWAAPFAGERFAPVVETAGAPAVDMDSLAVQALPDGGVRYVIRFREPFEPPSDGYRVAVNVGDPTGKRTRWTLSIAGGEATGAVENGDGTVWDPVGSSPVSLDALGGTATIDAQLGELTPDSALWAEAELPTPGGSLSSSTTYVPFDSLAPAPISSGQPTSTWGWPRDASGARTEGAVRVPGAPPAVTLEGTTLVVSASDAAPNLLFGQPVTAVADLVRVIDPAVPSGEAGYVLVNRVTGEVQVFRILDGEAVEVPDAGVVPDASAEASAAEAPSTRSVPLEVPALVSALGVTGDPASLGVGVDRAFTLADGSVITSTGVGSTVGSLQAAAPVPEPEATGEQAAPPAAEPSDEDRTVAVALAVGLGLLVVAAATVTAVAVRRRRRRHDSLLAEGWFDDELAPREPVRVPGGASTAEEVVDLDAAERATAGGNGAHGGNGSNGETAHGHEVDARATQEQALADLEAQFADLFARVDRLGSSRGGAS